MRFEDLRFVCEEAAKDVVARGERPVRPTVVVPGEDKTRLLILPEFPPEDQERHDYLVNFAQEQILDRGVPAWGFLIEGELDDRDVVVIAYGARKHAPQISAAPFKEDGTLGDFLPGEELDPTALPFLHPLQHAVDSLPPLEENQGDQGGLPIVP